jgi:hypothetical protein
VVKGKYSARAANRAASLDNDVIVDLRRDVARVTEERDTVTRELAVLKSDFDSAVMKAVATATASERRRLDDERKHLADEASQVMRDAAYEVADYMSDSVAGLQEKFGKDVHCFPSSLMRDTDSVYPSIARLFKMLGVAAEAGNLLEQILAAGDVFKNDGHGRSRRRRTVGDLNRHLHDNTARLAKRDLKKKFVTKVGADEQEA